MLKENIQRLLDISCELENISNHVSQTNMFTSAVSISGSLSQIAKLVSEAVSEVAYSLEELQNKLPIP